MKITPMTTDEIFFPCAGGCGKQIEQSEIIWATDDGKLTVEFGKPWCDACLPMEEDEDPDHQEK